jgi:Zn-dependent protease
MENFIHQFSIWVIPVLFAIVLHEVAHGYVASLLGDNTAKSLGRLSVNPIKHIDLVGTIIVPSVLLFLGGFVFGWAKPVPVNFNALHKPKRDMAIVALAGPFANFLMAIFWLIVLNLELSPWLVAVALAGISINIMLMVLNLLPILPLDGGRILTALLPNRLAYQFAQTERYGFFILIGLIYFGLLGKILTPVIYFFFHLLGL